MDKELNSIADNIIKDSFGSAAPSEGRPTTSGNSFAAPASPVAPSPVSENPVAPNPAAATPVAPSPTATSPVAPENPVPPATPRETFTAETPRPIPPQRPLNPMAAPSREKANEYNRIKEQMSAAREASNIPSPATMQSAPQPGPQQGLNKLVLLIIILIPVLVVAVGVLIAVLNQPSGNNSSNSQQSSSSTTQYKDPRETAQEIDLSTYTSEIQITEPGYYILSGTTNFPVKVNADGEVTLYLHNISITATDASALSNFSTNPLIIFLDDGTESTLAVADPATFDSIFSEGDLTIDGGTGILNVTGIKIADGHHYDVTGNGIKDTKGVTVIDPESPEVPGNNSTVQPNDSTAMQPEDGSAVKPAEGESGFQGDTRPAESGEATAPVEPTPTTN